MAVNRRSENINGCFLQKVIKDSWQEVLLGWSQCMLISRFTLGQLIFVTVQNFVNFCVSFCFSEEVIYNLFCLWTILLKLLMLFCLMFVMIDDLQALLLCFLQLVQ
ncbi:hypothetical protein DsansV1_C05g0056221 [Dioscorea sansibarensis]